MGFRLSFYIWFDKLCIFIWVLHLVFFQIDIGFFSFRVIIHSGIIIWCSNKSSGNGKDRKAY